MVEQDFVEVCRIRDVPATRPLRIELDGQGILVCRVVFSFAAVSEICPHEGASLTGGTVVRGKLRCPLHLTEFDLRSGACEDAPYPPLRTWPLRVEGDRILLARQS